MAVSAKKKKTRWQVPPLHLSRLLQRENSNNSASTSSPGPSNVAKEDEEKPTGARTAPVSSTDYIPACPKCGCIWGEEVRHWKFWKEWNTWVWHCSHVIPATSDMGPCFCGHMWVEENRRGRCYTCRTPMRIQECKKMLVFYCPGCNDYSQ
jgi:hypothetical protein